MSSASLKKHQLQRIRDYVIFREQIMGKIEHDQPVITFVVTPAIKNNLLPRIEGQRGGGDLDLDAFTGFKNATMGPAVLEGIALAKGYDATTIDTRFNPHPGQLTQKDIEQIRRSQVVGFSSLHRGEVVTIRLNELVKEINSDIFTYAGGYGPMFEDENYLAPRNGSKGVDAVVRGEGDKTLFDAIEAKRNGSPLENIPGISFIKNGKIIRTPDRLLLTEQELSELPIPSFPDNIKKNSRADTIITRRGCIYNCTFCCVSKMHGGKTRAEGDDRVIAQFKQSKRRKEKFIVDDNYAPITKIDQVLKTTLRIIDEGFNDSHIWMQLDAVTVNKVPGFAWLLRQMGVFGVCVGLESMSAEVLKEMHKAANPQMNKDAIKEFQKAGIFTYAMTMIGSKGETPQDVDNLLKFLIESNVNAVQICPQAPLPGTDLAQEKEFILPVQKDPNLVNGHLVTSLPPDGFTLHGLQKKVFAMDKEIYSFHHVRNILKPLRFIRSDTKRSLELAAANILFRFYAQNLMRKIIESEYTKDYLRELEKIDQEIYEKGKRVVGTGIDKTGVIVEFPTKSDQ